MHFEEFPMLPFSLVHPCSYVVGVFLASWATTLVFYKLNRTGIEPARLSVQDTSQTGTKNRQFQLPAMISRQATFDSGIIDTCFHTLVPSAWDFDGSTITVCISMTWKRHDDRKVIVAPDGVDAWPDDTLIRALARAHRWKGLLEERTADRLGNWPKHRVSSFVNRLLRLTLLAPDIVEAILEG